MTNPSKPGDRIVVNGVTYVAMPEQSDHVCEACAFYPKRPGGCTFPLNKDGRREPKCSPNDVIYVLPVDAVTLKLTGWSKA